MQKESKHIVIVGPAYPLRGGLATYNQLLATKLQKQGHIVRILTFSLQYPKILFPGKTQYSSDPEPENLDIEVGLNSINPFNWISIGNKLKKESPDLVIFRYWMPFIGPCLGTVGRIIRRNKKTKIVTIADNIIPHEKTPFDKMLTSYFVKSSDGFVTMSKAVLDDLKQFDKFKPAMYNPHPMYENFGPQLDKAIARKKLGLEENGKYLLFFGFIRKYKGLDILLKAFANKKIQESGIKLIIAGEYYESPDEYTAIIKKHNLEGSIIQANHFIPDSEVSTYFSASDMVVQTYKTATQSGVTQIAYYYNKPMLVTNVGGLSELVPHQKVGYVTSLDVSEISDYILDFYENNRETEFVENIKIERSRFTWDSMIDKLLSVVGLK
ncbi:MAG: glycosyl transferase family 1 [Bacteroidetes bacterium]|nr:MAG: glycosyl transferase family 1 [Bacteroidota bacterium]